MAAKQQNPVDLADMLADLRITTEVTMTEKELGTGSDAIVRVVEWEGGSYAGKQLHAHHLNDKKCIENFAAECRKWSELDHSKIVKFFGVYFKHGSRVPTLILEKMEMSLWEYLKSNEENFPLRSKVYILHQTSEALVYLHNHNPPLVHCDVNPNNILLNRTTLETKLTDFGMARATDESMMTRKTSVKGTQAFTPPEALCVPPKYNEKRDLFAYGNVVITTVTHEWPHPGSPTMYDDKNNLIACTEFKRRKEHLDKFEPQEKDYFWPIIERCLQNRPEERPTSRELVEEILKIEDKITASGAPIVTSSHLTATPPTSGYSSSLVRMPTNKDGTDESSKGRSMTADGHPNLPFSAVYQDHLMSRERENNRMLSFKRMNITISSNLLKRDLESLQYLLETHVPLKDLEEANSGVKVFQLLEQRGLYTPQDVQLVKDALESLGRNDLKKHIVEYENTLF